MTTEQAFEKWWYGPEAWNDDDMQSRSKQAFLAGKQYQEMNQLMVLADIRKAVGDGEGKLMGDELVKRIQTLVAMTSVIHGNYITFSADDTMLIDGKSVTTEKEEA